MNNKLHNWGNIKIPRPHVYHYKGLRDPQKIVDALCTKGAFDRKEIKKI